ncbi:hypothetical protein F5Y17DRAFT_414659 [Xylariaceae sp. FL0594]|nr:hypothetical protein F5Y17DRAFT_414659 [Xylariaceae sp. FL0594]
MRGMRGVLSLSLSLSLSLFSSIFLSLSTDDWLTVPTGFRARVGRASGSVMIHTIRRNPVNTDSWVAGRLL